MRVFIYEYTTGGGLWHSDHSPGDDHSLLMQGSAMVRAVTEDFGKLTGVEVVSTRDLRLPELHVPECRVSVIASKVEDEAAIKHFAAAADWTLLIAPETGGELERYARLVESAGGNLLSPGSRVAALAADKHRTAEHLAARNVPVPKGILVASVEIALRTSLKFPLVIKPVDGCGSESVRLIREAADLEQCLIRGPLRLEEYVPGLAASVSVLCGPRGNITLPACRQLLSSDGRFEYLGGRFPLEPELDCRARKLALAAASALTDVRGYIGIDLILGCAGDGSGDAVIEINPRLTTSYVGLRKVARRNLASAMLAIARGEPADLRFGAEQVEFAADGTMAQSS